MFYLVSLVSARTGVGAMDATKRTFGSRGSVLFSAANFLQLVGWTAIMIQSGAVAATQIVPALGTVGWCVVIAALIVAWIAFGVTPDSGPGLVFVTLPGVFNQMWGGQLWGTLFFLFMSFAALSSVIAVFENIMGFSIDQWGFSPEDHGKSYTWWRSAQTCRYCGR